MAFYGSPPGSQPFVPSASPNSVGLGINSLQDDSSGANNVAIGINAGNQITTGANNLVLGPNVASTTLATGSNNIIVGTTASADAATASTSNSLWIGGGTTAVMSATAINSTPVVTVPGSLTVTGALTASGGLTGTVTGIGGSVGGIATGTFSQASNTTLTTVTGMSATLVAGATYVFWGYLSCSSGATTTGLNLALTGTGGLTATSFVSDTWSYNTTTLNAETNQSTFGSLMLNAAQIVTTVEFSGSIVVNAGGTVVMQAAQKTSGTTAVTVANGSMMVFTRVA
jgi:trimeric autotransporter adhesin